MTGNIQQEIFYNLDKYDVSLWRLKISIFGIEYVKEYLPPDWIHL